VGRPRLSTSSTGTVRVPEPRTPRLRLLSPPRALSCAHTLTLARIVCSCRPPLAASATSSTTKAAAATTPPPPPPPQRRRCSLRWRRPWSAAPPQPPQINSSSRSARCAPAPCACAHLRPSAVRMHPLSPPPAHASPCAPLLTASRAPSCCAWPSTVFAVYLRCGVASAAADVAYAQVRLTAVRTRPGSLPPAAVLPRSARPTLARA